MLTDIITKIRSDNDHLTDRRILHENYEWLEHFWRKKYNNGDNSIDNFIDEKASFFWQIENIKNFARQFASIECVGSNKKDDYTQTEPVAQATMYLRFHCDLFNGNVQHCDSIQCRHHKISVGLCTAENGRKWNNDDNNNKYAFKALMYIVRQIRNNLFHGHKMTLDQDQFNRDKVLVSLAAQTTLFLIDNLVSSGG